MNYEKCKYCDGTGKQIDQKALGRELRALRLASGMSLRQLAKIMGISAPYLSDLELGRRMWGHRQEDYKLALKSKAPTGNGPISIYGLFDESGICHYVGATKSPQTRRTCHKVKYPNLQFKVFRKCRASVAGTLEKEAIEFYKNIGQAKLNVAIIGRRKGIFEN